jgi:hypothetical protein
LEVVVNGATTQAHRYDVDLTPTPGVKANEVCFDTPPYSPSDPNSYTCFAVRETRPVTVEVVGGKARIVEQPRVAPVKCPSPQMPADEAGCEKDTARSKLFERLDVLEQPRVSFGEGTVTDVGRLPSQLEISHQPVVRTRTGLIGRGDLKVQGWMWAATIGLLAAAAAVGLLTMNLRLKGVWLERGRFAGLTLAGGGLAAFALTILVPFLILWLPTVGEKAVVAGPGLRDLLLPSGGLLALAVASTRQFLRANQGGQGAGPADRGGGGGMLKRAWLWLSAGREQLGWYELTPLKVLLAVLLAVGFVVLFIGQLQYASANGLGGTLLGLPFIRQSLPGWLWWPEWLRWITVVALLVAFAMLVDAYAWSLYPYYKRCLSSAFLLRTSGQKATAYEYQKLIPFSATDGSHGLPRGSAENPRRGPTLVLCCAVNLSEYGVVPPARRAASFTFSPDFIGGPVVGYVPADVYWNNLPESRRRDITLASAMAISGAAFSPAMGKRNLGTVGCVMAIANLRLGIWLPHPQRVAQGPNKRWCGLHRPGWIWFLREVTNTYQFQRRYLYVSDGGHWDNLGLVELLRRGCTEIVCVSAAGDGSTSFGTIAEAMALAREEVGVEWVEFDPSPLRPPTKATEPLPERELRRPDHRDTAAPFCPADFVVGKFRYENGVTGTITYVETAITADVPFDVHGFAESEAIFPDDSTADQVFNHRQFEAFRALGHHQVSRAVGPPPPPPAVPSDGSASVLPETYTRSAGA